MLHDDGGDVVADLGRASASVRRPRTPRARTPPLARRSRASRRTAGRRPRLTRTRRTRAGPRHVHGLDERGRAVVQRGVRDLHAGELADHRLELEQRLQRALGELRLVRACTTCRTPSDPRAPRRRSGRSGRRRPRPRSTRARRRARFRDASAPEVGHDLHLGDAVGEVEVAVEPHRGGDLVEEGVERRRRRPSRASRGRRPRCAARTSRRAVYGRGARLCPARQPDASSRPYFVTRDR